MKVLTVRSPETPQTAINVKQKGNRHPSNLLPWQSTFDQDKGETVTVTVFLFPKLFLERSKSSLLKNLSRAAVGILMITGTLSNPHKSPSVWA
jgi:hypothetical protein